MRYVALLITMAIVGYLVVNYINSPSIKTADGSKQAPEQILEKTRQDAKKIEDDMAKRAAQTVPPGTTP
jgi:hypothetical protein